MRISDYPISFDAGGARIAVVRAGDGWLAADKPAKMSMHNDPGEDLVSVLKGFLETRPDLTDAIGYDPDRGIHPVHRLDQETSGVAIFATSPKAVESISRQFENRTVRKLYCAILHGNFEEDRKEGFWTWPLSKKPGGRRFVQGQGKRAACRTGYEVLGQSAHYALVACRPLTGRSHQIRRHAKLAGHPVAGDPRYGSTRSLKYLKDTCGFDRMALHALRLSFVPPAPDEVEAVLSSRFPVEMERLFAEDGGEPAALERILDARKTKKGES